MKYWNNSIFQYIQYFKNIEIFQYFNIFNIFLYYSIIIQYIEILRSCNTISIIFQYFELYWIRPTNSILFQYFELYWIRLANSLRSRALVHNSRTPVAGCGKADLQCKERRRRLPLQESLWLVNDVSLFYPMDYTNFVWSAFCFLVFCIWVSHLFLFDQRFVF